MSKSPENALFSNTTTNYGVLSTIMNTTDIQLYIVTV